MQIIGLLGGVASGKSMVARQLVELGAGLLDADGIGHEVLRLAEVETAARQRWGASVFGSDGRIDRARLARIVFAADPDGKRERRYLEEITHQEIVRRLRQRVDSLAAAGAKVVVLDAALLLEVGLGGCCAKLVFVESSREARLERALSRGWSEKEFSVREGAQQSLDRKRERADVILDNSGSPEQTQAQVERLWASLV